MSGMIVFVCASSEEKTEEEEAQSQDGAVAITYHSVRSS